MDFEDLRTYHNQKFEGQEKEFLNASTADFNKAIKQINQQLQDEGQLSPTENEEHLRKLAQTPSTIQEEQHTLDMLNGSQIDVDDISIVVPREEPSSRYTSRQSISGKEKLEE